jgi:hypothetical protein
MNSVRHLLILVILSLLASTLKAGEANQKPKPIDHEKAVGHGRLLEKLYPTPAMGVLVQTDTPHEAYQAAINAAYRAGVPPSILNECVAMRAMMKGDVAALQRLLPILKTGLEKYTPETSMFPEKSDAANIVSTIEEALLEEQRSPGAVARRAKQATEIGIARKIRAQLISVDALVDVQSLGKNLRDGAPVAEAEWRAGAKPGSYFTTTGADELGNPFGAQVVGKRPTVPKASYERLKAYVPDTFWSPFGVPR